MIVLCILLDEVVCKVCIGGLKDDFEDLDLLVWVGVLLMVLLLLLLVVEVVLGGMFDYVQEWRDSVCVQVVGVVML